MRQLHGLHIDSDGFTLTSAPHLQLAEYINFAIARIHKLCARRIKQTFRSSEYAGESTPSVIACNSRQIPAPLHVAAGRNSATSWCRPTHRFESGVGTHVKASKIRASEKGTGPNSQSARDARKFPTGAGSYGLTGALPCSDLTRSDARRHVAFC